jgi:hypothetical protein
MRSAEQLRDELHDTKRRRDAAVREVKEQTTECDEAIEAIERSGTALKQTPFGAGMSSMSLDAVNPAKDEIRSTLITNAVDPAVTAVEGIKDSLNEL